MGCLYVNGGYIDQPLWFVELYKIMLETEAEYEKASARRSAK